MPSAKERERWKRWYEVVDQRMKAQRAALTRLVLMMTEAGAALHEIADGDLVESGMRQRARRALDVFEEPAAATARAIEELDAEEVPDPRRSK